MSVFTFIEHKKCEVTEIDECVINSVDQYLICGDNHVDVLQKGVPDRRIRPRINVVIASKDFDLGAGNLGPDGVILLLTEGDGRGQEPYDLYNRFSQLIMNV